MTNFGAIHCKSDIVVNFLSLIASQNKKAKGVYDAASSFSFSST